MGQGQAHRGTVTVILALLGASCSSNADDPTSVSAVSEGDRRAILMLLETEGFDSSTAEFSEDSVRVEGDIRFKLEDLIQRTHQVVDKGYSQSSTPFAASLDLRLDSALPESWKSAFRYAADRWSVASWNGQNINISINESNPGLGVDVIWGWDLEPCVFADAGYPTTLSVGNVEVNALYSESGCGCTLTTAVKRKIAMHELGHILGFKHPSAFDFAHYIPGTLPGSNYATVMKQGCNTDSDLSSDDKESAAIIYGF